MSSLNGFSDGGYQSLFNMNSLSDQIDVDSLIVESTFSLPYATANQPLKTNASKNVVSGLINLTTDVINILPIANGGTNSSNVLTNGKIMISSAGKIIEGTSSTDPSFNSLAITNGISSNGMLQYSTGTISQTATTITGSGTTFNSSMVGGFLNPSKGVPVVITAFVSTSQLTVGLSQSYTTSSYTIIYNLTAGYALTPTGTLMLRTQSAPSTSTTGLELQLVPNGAGASYNIDINTYNSPALREANGRMQFTDDNFGADFTYWSKIQGGDTNALQQLFKIAANKTVTTFNNTLDTTTTGAANFKGIVTAGQIIDSGLTATTLLASDASKQLQSVTITNSNGSNGSFSGSTLALSNSQDISTTGAPTFANITDSGLTASTLTSTNASKQLQSVIITNSNGSNGSFSGSTLALSNSQDVSITGTPTFAGIFDSGLTASLPVKTDISKQLISGLINLTSEITGTLPIANGGTNSSTALANGSIMVSSGGAIIEGTSSSSPNFTNVTASTLVKAPQVELTASSIQAIFSVGGTANRLFLGATTPVIDGTLVTIPDPGATAKFVLTQGNQTINDTLTITNAPVLSSTTISKLLATDASKKPQSVTIANSNGLNASFSGSTLTLSNSQDLSTTGTPTFANIIDSGLTVQTIVMANSSKQLVSAALGSTNGMAVTLTGGVLIVNSPQDVQTTAMPTFLGVKQTHACYFFGSSTTSIPNVTWTMPTYSTISIVDPSSMYAAATARFTLPATGTYLINVFCRLSDSALYTGPGTTDTTGVSLYYNGFDVGCQSFAMPDYGGRRCVNYTTIFAGTFGGFLQVYNYQACGSTITGNRMSISIVRVS